LNAASNKGWKVYVTNAGYVTFVRESIGSPPVPCIVSSSQSPREPIPWARSQAAKYESGCTATHPNLPMEQLIEPLNGNAIADFKSVRNLVRPPPLTGSEFGTNDAHNTIDN
jgi:hypothetical protein